jgi:hypothetical protein
MNARRRTRPRRAHSLRALRYTAILMTLLASLFMACWGANRVEQLERRKTELQRQLEFEGDEYRRLLSEWLRATSRDEVVGRAQRELALQIPTRSEREILVLPSTGDELNPPHPLLDHLARSLDRYAQIRGALAKEKQ